MLLLDCAGIAAAAGLAFRARRRDRRRVEAEVAAPSVLGAAVPRSRRRAPRGAAGDRRPRSRTVACRRDPLRRAAGCGLRSMAGSCRWSRWATLRRARAARRAAPEAMAMTEIAYAIDEVIDIVALPERDRARRRAGPGRGRGADRRRAGRTARSSLAVRAKHAGDERASRRAALPARRRRSAGCATFVRPLLEGAGYRVADASCSTGEQPTS